MKKKIGLLVVLTALMFCIFAVTASATDIFYDGQTPVVLKWMHKSGSRMYITCSNDYLKAPLLGSYSSARSRWTSACPNQILMPDVSFQTSKCDFATPTEAWWEGEYGTPAQQVLKGVITFGVTWQYDDNGQRINTLADAKAAEGKIRLAAIYLNPFLSAYDGTYEAWGVPEFSSTDKIKLLAHELGHAMGMGHSNVGPKAVTNASIMKSQFSSQSSSPQSYDKNEVTRLMP